MKIHLAIPHGFCAGVDRAIEIVERTLVMFGSPVYVRHEVVHNKYVVNELVSKGAVFVDDLADIPDKSIVIFSAHGVSQKVRDEASKRGLQVFDATCPLVTKVHLEVASCAKKSTEVVLIGHAGHPEVEGTLGQYNNADGNIYLVESTSDVAKLKIKHPDNLSYVTQTTLSVDDTKDIIDVLISKFPLITAPKKDDICYATQNRQNAVRKISSDVGIFLVIGSANSSNSNRLKELAEKNGVDSYLIDDERDLVKNWFNGINHIGITAGASAPEKLVQDVITKLQNWFDIDAIEDNGEQERVHFQLPHELRNSA